MRLMKKLAAVGLVAGAAAAGSLAVAAPASAAAYNGACGEGYAVVNSAAIGSKGTVFLTYNSSNGYNCAVTVRNSSGSAVRMGVWLATSPSGAWKSDVGNYTTYAGPVYVYGADSCMDWVGEISGTLAERGATNCG
ncbi:spore-associated protein A [Actinorugispora endophytica]|uniref:Spore-associated protein A n=1 Tax=Actinorugispora endophytica TaxID=1605990 RepID=A0A4R6UY23_9ACTN|nr:spore-associated protein A [Actinorugispora endophytica]TDQ52190.1 hypothetical protein EV190_10720 [Actinorugispora endophytica]